jgi:hypothetical protein
MALPSDQDREFMDPRRPQSLERVRQERLSRHREKGFRKIRGEGAHPRALSGRED